jgi:predicted exporter
MSGDAGLIVKKILPRDPTGETLQILEQFIGENQPSTSDDIWVSRDGKRAVLLQLGESGLNTDAQAAALEDVKQAFASLPGRHADTRLVMSGTSVISVASRNIIQSEVERLAALGTVLVVALLLLVYRSLPLLLLGLIPVVSGALVGIASVSLGFGHVHGLTLGFGTTLIGEAVDYSIYLFIQRAGGGNPSHFWRTIRLGVLTSATGFAALMCSSFPGLSQLGLYSISGLLTAALVTRYVCPA